MKRSAPEPIFTPRKNLDHQDHIDLTNEEISPPTFLVGSPIKKEEPTFIEEEELPSFIEEEPTFLLESPIEEEPTFLLESPIEEEPTFLVESPHVIDLTKEEETPSEHIIEAPPPMKIDVSLYLESKSFLFENASVQS